MPSLREPDQLPDRALAESDAARNGVRREIRWRQDGASGCLAVSEERSVMKRILDHIGGLLVFAGGIALLLYGVPIVAAVLGRE